MPIPVIVENGLMETAMGLKAAGSLMWTGTPVPHNLKELATPGVPLAANVKPFQDRDKMLQGIDEILEAGMHWLGVEIAALANSGSCPKPQYHSDHLSPSPCWRFKN